MTDASLKLSNNRLYIFTGMILLIGWALALFSWLNTCTEACEEEHKYRLFGLSFGIIGLIYFTGLLVAFLLSFRSSRFLMLMGLLLFLGIGAETLFIGVQKYVIEAWCPICLGIAGTLLLSVACFIKVFFDSSTRLHMTHSRRIRNFFAAISAMAVGFLIAFAGVAKHDDLEAAENGLQKRLFLGNKDSNVEVYVFTSWICPACRHLEPALERMSPAILQKAKVVFVDYGDDVTSLNFLPYNLSFMLNDPASYVALRHMLKEIAKDTDSPTDAQVEKEAAKLGIAYKQLNYADVALGISYFKNLTNRFKVTTLPALIAVNPITHQKKEITGIGITETNALETIKALQ